MRQLGIALNIFFCSLKSFLNGSGGMHSIPYEKLRVDRAKLTLLAKHQQVAGKPYHRTTGHREIRHYDFNIRKFGMQILYYAFDSIGVTAGSMKNQGESLVSGSAIKRVHEAIDIFPINRRINPGFLKKRRCIKTNRVSITKSCYFSQMLLQPSVKPSGIIFNIFKMFG